MSSSSNIERRLFDIPSDVEFPIELSSVLKSKLHTALEQNWHLKRHVDYLDKEVMELRKYKADQLLDNTNTHYGAQDQDSNSPFMASKLVELSKKNRDMTAQIESMKTKMKQIMAENEQLKTNRNYEGTIECDQSQPDTTELTGKEGEDFISSAQQISQITNKMMEYRRQCQQLRLELRTALRVLAQEVGEGATPQNVLSLTNSKSWRGRQQQILALQQKVQDKQGRLSKAILNNDQVSECNGGGDLNLDHNDAFSVTSEKTVCSIISSNRLGIVQHDRKKLEQIGKLSSQLEQVTQELRTRQQELKATKARTQTLECQTKSFRNQIEILEIKLREKETDCQTHWNEMSQLKHDLGIVKDKDKRNRDKNILELQEANRALARERSIVARLQQVITEKQDAVQRLDGEIIELRNKLELCCSSTVHGGLDALERIQYLETQLNQASEMLNNNEKERQGLVDMLNNGINQTEEERNKAIKLQQQVSKIFTVLIQANKCIDECLDAAQITNTALLQEVENIRTLIRELKTGGELYSLDQETGLSAKKLKIKVSMLTKEVQVLQSNLHKLEQQRKSDLNNYKQLSEQTKIECLKAVKQNSSKCQIPVPVRSN